MVSRSPPVLIDWAKIRKEFDWLKVTQSESYTVSYLLRHPEVIAPNLELLGTEVALPDGPGLKSNHTPAKLAFADIIFSDKDRHRYYLVEAKESSRQEKEGLEQAEHNAELLDIVLKRNGASGYEVIPVFAAVTYPKGDEYGYLQGQHLE